jgi:hypothetical protein
MNNNNTQKYCNLSASNKVEDVAILLTIDMMEDRINSDESSHLDDSEKLDTSLESVTQYYRENLRQLKILLSLREQEKSNELETVYNNMYEGGFSSLEEGDKEDFLEYKNDLLKRLSSVTLKEDAVQGMLNLDLEELKVEIVEGTLSLYVDIPGVSDDELRLFIEDVFSSLITIEPENREILLESIVSEDERFKLFEDSVKPQDIGKVILKKIERAERQINNDFPQKKS